MRHRILAPLAALTLAACAGEGTQEDAASFALEAGQWEEGERSGLCVQADGRAAFVLYAEGGTNCMAEGRIGETEEGELGFVPRGDEECRIPIEREGDTLRFGNGGAACAYYCGGEAEYAGRSLTLQDGSDRELLDAGGEAIC